MQPSPIQVHPGSIHVRCLRVLGLLLFVAAAFGISGCSGGGTPGSFVLSVSPATVSVQAGGSAQISVVATPSGNFTTPVNVAIAGLPAGVTASPATVTLMPGVAQTVTLAAAGSVTAGSSTVTLTGVGGAVTQMAAVALTVTPAPTFSLTATPGALSVQAGSSGSFSVMATAANGFTAPVSVAVAGLPAGVTASPATLTLTPGTAQNVTLTAASTAVATTAGLTLTGTGGSVTKTAGVALTITPAPTFALAVTPGSVSVQAGSSGGFSVVATPANGFNSPVTVAVSGLPAGVTASPVTLTLTPGVAQTVTLAATTAAAVTTGTKITLSGSAGSLVQTASVAVAVTAAPSFTLAAAPATVALQASGTAVVNVTATAANGFASPVAVMVSGLPAGVTASPATLSLTPGVAGSFTLTASSTAQVATGTITLTGTSGSLTQNATVALSVTGAAGFALTATPAALAVQAGGSGQVSVLATAANGFTSPVVVAVAGLPAGVTASPATLTLTPGTAQVLTLTAAVAATVGSSNVTLTGTSGSQSQSAAVALTVGAAPSFALGISAPTSNLTAGGAGVPVTFQVVPANGFAGTVAVTLSGLSAGVTAVPGTTFNVVPGTNTVVTFTAAVSATPGSITIQVAGTTTANAQPNTSTNVLSGTILPPTGPDIATYHYDNTRQGWNSQEVMLTVANVNSTNFGLRGVYPVDGKVDAQPLYVGGLSFGTGSTAVLANAIYAVTENDSVYALHAGTGAQLWKSSVLGTGETPSDNRGCGQVTPQIGITSTPVIDRSYGTNGAIFVIGMSKDASGGYHQRLHALDLVTGAELPNSPTEITASYPGNGAGSVNGTVPFTPGQYVARAGLLLMNGTIYVGWSSHCDIAPYTGWMMAYSEATLRQTAVLNLTPNGSDGSIWMSGYGLAGDSSGNIYFADANGTLDAGFNANGFPSQSDFGNAIVKLTTAAGSLAVIDYWEPYNTQAESNADVDLGSGGAMLLPDLADSAGVVRHLVVVAGKDRNVYVADRDNLGKFAANSNSTLYQELAGVEPNGVWAGPAYFANTVYFGGVGDTLKAYSVTNALLSTAPTSQSTTVFGYPGATPSVSSNGAQNGIVWALESGENAAAVLHAYDATNLQHELYNSNQAANGRDAFGTGNKFLTPAVSNGMVFVGTPNAVAVFGLLH